ncbi:MAG: dihydrofolate reductase [Acidiferrobacterales bacterium]
MISIIAAIAKNGVIGNNNTLPWHLPVDLKYFRNTTMGHAIVMGRRNYEDIGKALPGRRNIVLTRDENYSAENCEIAHSINDVLGMIDNKDETFIIGGAEIYLSFLPYAEKLYITHIDVEVDGDVVFPKYKSGEWELESEETHAADSKNPLSCRFTVYRHRG